MHATYPDISDPQSRPSRYFTERTILTTHKGTVDGLSHSILTKFSGVTHTFAAMTRLSVRLRKGEDTILRMFM